MHRDDPHRLADARHSDRVIRAPRGSVRTAKSWLTEAPLRMLMNNLDPEVAERPHELVVYGGIGRAARNWACYDAIVAALLALNDDESVSYRLTSVRCSVKATDRFAGSRCRAIPRTSQKRTAK
jgi:hypothetical protein